MFKRLRDVAPAGDDVVILLDGETVSVPAGLSVAAALFFLDAVPSRQTPVGCAPRAPFCMMGACFECLIEVDGVGDQRACQLEVRSGMRLRRQLPAREGDIR